MSSEKANQTYSKITLSVLRRRAEFLAVAAHGKKWVAPGVVIQFCPVPESKQSTIISYGLTASRKVGNAVLRNKARRRLRALAQEVLVKHAIPSFQYVLIARPASIACNFNDLRSDIIAGLKRMKAWRE